MEMQIRARTPHPAANLLTNNSALISCCYGGATHQLKRHASDTNSEMALTDKLTDEILFS
jgi:hypothetical protein